MVNTVLGQVVSVGRISKKCEWWHGVVLRPRSETGRKTMPPEWLYRLDTTERALACRSLSSKVSVAEWSRRLKSQNRLGGHARPGYRHLSGACVVATVPFCFTGIPPLPVNVPCLFTVVVCFFLYARQRMSSGGKVKDCNGRMWMYAAALRARETAF